MKIGNLNQLKDNTRSPSINIICILYLLMSHAQAKSIRFTIPDFLKEYWWRWLLWGLSCTSLITILKAIPVVGIQLGRGSIITPEAYGVYFVYETPEGVIKHYKIVDFYEDDEWDCAGDYEERFSFEEVKPKTLEEAMKRIDELEKKLAEMEA